MPNWQILRQFLVGLCFLAVAFEYNSLNLFLWPVEHSCARLPGSNLLGESLTDVHNQPIDWDVVQTRLIDASTDDATTLIRAASMGINYEDISHCFEYPIEHNVSSGQYVVNMESLEPCKDGIHFGSLGGTNLSLLGHFNLACSRQWLKALLPLMIPIGMMVGLLLKNLAKRIDDEMQPMNRRASANYGFLKVVVRYQIYLWLPLVILTSELTHNFARKNGRQTQVIALNHGSNDDDYLSMLACVLIRSASLILIYSNVDRNYDLGLASKESSVPERNLRDFIIFSASWITGKIIFLPLALRLFSDWSKLNQLLTILVLLLRATTFFYEYRAARMAKFQTEQRRARDFISLLRVDSANEIISEGAPPVNEAVQEPSPGDREINMKSEANDFQGASTSAGPIAKVCEYCLARAMEAHQPGSQVSSAYNPTTAEIGQFHYSPVEGALTHDASLAPPLRVRRNLGNLHMNVVDKNSIWQQTVVLTFCLMLNYFLIQMMPNHKLMHVETIGSLRNRKDDFHTELESPQQRGLPGSMTFTYNTSHQKLELKGGEISRVRAVASTTSIRPTRTASVPNNLESKPIASKSSRPTDAASTSMTSAGTSATPAFKSGRYIQEIGTFDLPAVVKNESLGMFADVRMRVFDYHDHNYAFGIIKSLKYSANPLRLLVNTMTLNGWFIELSVFLLYLSNIANFRMTYFKLQRMFTIARFGSRLLIAEWLMIALMSPRKDHLIGNDWLAIVATLTTRYLTTLMLFQHLDSMLRLSYKLQTNDLFAFEATSFSTWVAFAFAVLAPLYERSDLIIIPLVFMLTNCCVYKLARNLDQAFKDSLCPMIFDE